MPFPGHRLHHRQLAIPHRQDSEMKVENVSISLKPAHLALPHLSVFLVFTKNGKKKLRDIKQTPNWESQQTGNLETEPCTFQMQ